MSGTSFLRTPADCTPEELREFARLVREGFAAAPETLDGRIRDAECLAFHYAASGALGAIAALKAPGEPHREEIFRKAVAPAGAGEYRLDLGWVFVLPAHRRNGVAGNLCRRLLARVPGSAVFATTRTNNVVMMRILLALGFERAGRPYRRRDEELALFLRPPPAAATPRPPS